MDYPDKFYAKRAYAAYCKAMSIDPAWESLSTVNQYVWLAVAKTLWSEFRSASGYRATNAPFPK